MQRGDHRKFFKNSKKHLKLLQTFLNRWKPFFSWKELLSTDKNSFEQFGWNRNPWDDWGKLIFISFLYNYSTLLTQGKKYLPINNQWEARQRLSIILIGKNHGFKNKLVNVINEHHAIVRHYNNHRTYKQNLYWLDFHLISRKSWLLNQHDRERWKRYFEPCNSTHLYCNWNWPFQQHPKWQYAGLDWLVHIGILLSL
jgi:hypothetical protein